MFLFGHNYSPTTFLEQLKRTDTLINILLIITMILRYLKASSIQCYLHLLA